MIQTPILIPAEQYSKGEKCPLRATVMRAKYVIIIFALGSAHENAASEVKYTTVYKWQTIQSIQ